MRSDGGEWSTAVTPSGPAALAVALVVPLPTALLLGGLLAGLLLALLARPAAGVGARRRRARVQRRLDEAVARVADELVVAPVNAELRAYGDLRDAVAGLR